MNQYAAGVKALGPTNDLLSYSKKTTVDILTDDHHTPAKQFRDAEALMAKGKKILIN